MIRLFLFAVVAAPVFLALRWLVRYSTRRDSSNAGGGSGLAHDSTHAAYEHSAKELMQMREADLPAPRPAPAVRIQIAEEKPAVPETRVGE